MWMWDGGNGHMGDWGWGWGLLGMVMMLVFWGGLALLIVYAVRGSLAGPGRQDASRRTEDRALDTLRERYARGEIDRSEYEERRRTLTDAGQAP